MAGKSIVMMPLHSGCGMPVTHVSVLREIQAEVEFTWGQENSYHFNEQTSGLEDNGLEFRCEACLTQIHEEEVKKWILDHVAYRESWMKEKHE